MHRNQFHPTLLEYIRGFLPEMEHIPPRRSALLLDFAQYLQRVDSRVSLIFICTHNSRRSHFAQIWASTAAAWYGVEGVETYSGGTEATAFNPRAVAALERAGFQVEDPGGDNPVYRLTFAAGGPSLECFSKVYDDAHNPRENFVAVMTCSEADEHCPFIPGTALRIPLTYEDPKEADNTPEETARYDERCRQIARELFFLFSQIKK
ncbi:MAG: protein-tyrosine-phosphatase [Saprospirales bacterium]|nr:protein-tyrosine-phosphatase [Saprospirales bacterium]